MNWRDELKMWGHVILCVAIVFGLVFPGAFWIHSMGMAPIQMLVALIVLALVVTVVAHYFMRWLIDLNYSEGRKP